MASRTHIRSIEAAIAGLLAVAALVQCTGTSGGASTDAGQDAASDVGATEAGVDAEDVGDESHADADDAARACPDGGVSTELECTGLYRDILAKTIAPDVVAYKPSYAFWSDGAVKSRWIRLPPATKIDTSDMDEWVFPKGTTLWKEFVVGGQRIETRMLQKRDDGTWSMRTFQWLDGETHATELVNGQRHVDGGTYEIPPASACNVCHSGRIDNVLGFEAMSLAGPDATGLTMDELVLRDLVTKAPTAPLTVPGDVVTKAALVWLHANCGTACHNASPQSVANFTYMYFRLNVGGLASPSATDTYKTAVNWGSTWQPADGGTVLRIAAGDPGRSAVVIRASTRDDAQLIQMPPLVTHLVDDAGVEALKAWILTL